MKSFLNTNNPNDLQNKSFEYRRSEFMQTLYNKYTTRPLTTVTKLRAQNNNQLTARSNNQPSIRPRTQAVVKLRESKPKLILAKLETSFDNINNINPLKSNDESHSWSKRRSTINLESSDPNFQKNLKFILQSKNIVQIKDLFQEEETFFNNKKASFGFETCQKIEKIQCIKNEAECPDRFKKKAKLLILVLKVINSHKGSKDRIHNFQLDLDIRGTAIRNDLFNCEYFSRPKEPTFPDEVKKLLLLNPFDRTEDMIRYIIISLNFSVPEFVDYPIYMQKMIARHAFYQEFEPGRVLIRQGHLPNNYYMIISGSALVIETRTSSLKDDFVYTPVSTLKRGDTFGDQAIINNTTRNSSVTVHGNRPICLLSLDKEAFYLIQTPISSESQKFEFLTNKVHLLNFVGYPFHKLASDNQTNQAYFSIYYKNGSIICKNSQKDDWLYVVKSGSCKILRQIKFDQEALDFYLNAEKPKSFHLNKISDFSGLEKRNLYVSDKDGSNSVNKILNLKPVKNDIFKSLNLSQAKNKYVYLEMNKLREGDVFGLHDIILTEKDDNKVPLLLTSEGIECILINRRFFLKHLPAQSLLKLRFNLHPYAQDDYFIKKYFNSFKWKDYTNNCKLDAIKQTSLRRTKSIYN